MKKMASEREREGEGEEERAGGKLRGSRMTSMAEIGCPVPTLHIARMHEIPASVAHIALPNEIYSSALNLN